MSLSLAEEMGAGGCFFCLSLRACEAIQTGSLNDLGNDNQKFAVYFSSMGFVWIRFSRLMLNDSIDGIFARLFLI